MRPRPLENQWAIVTGASRGLGEAVARAFWDAGASLLLVARSESPLRTLAESLPAVEGQRAGVCAVDLADAHAAERVVATARAMSDRVDVLVNNAAIQGPIGPAWENDWDAWQNTVRVNLLAPVALCRAVVPWMREGGGGSIVNMAGGGATSSRPNFSAYAASKTALVRFSEVVADEGRPYGVRVNAIAPGVLPTAMQREILSAGVDRAGARDVETAARALNAISAAAFDEPAALCVFLASDASRNVSGRLISAVWDPWRTLADKASLDSGSEMYTLRRIVPDKT